MKHLLLTGAPGCGKTTVVRTPHPFVDALKERPDVTLIAVTPENRDHLPEEIIRRLA